MPLINTLEIDSNFGKFVLEPLERGYGQTIGNALRRVLLSSIPGPGIAAIRIDKVFHEFAPIPGCKEDTTEFILNLAGISLRSTSGQTFDEETLRIHVKGPGTVTGADIECPPGLEVVNKEHYVATISENKALLSVEIKVNWGAGYVNPDRHERYRNIIGLLPVGTQFTPIVKANYIVEQTRVGQRTDYERLTLEVTTNGSISPNESVAQAAHVLDKYFRIFFELGSGTFELPGNEEYEETEDLSNLPDLKIEDLDFSQRTYNCLRRAGLNSLRVLAGVSEGDLTAIRGFGKKSLFEVRDKLLEFGVEMKASKGGLHAEFDDEEEEEEIIQ